LKGYNVLGASCQRRLSLDTSVDFVFVLAVVILSIGLLLWFILVFVPQHFDDIRGPKDE
jgi:hypothetical protein